MVESTLKNLVDDHKVRDKQHRKRRLEAQTEAKKAKKPKQ